MGGSNGGLLVGATLTQRPDLAAAVVCSAPLLDMVRYEQFGLGRTWNDEYGTADDPVELGWLLGLLAVPRGAARAPPIRRSSSRPSSPTPASTRCTPASSPRPCSTRPAADAPIVLRRETSVGHGARAVSRTVGLAADQLAFLADHTGLARR